MKEFYLSFRKKALTILNMELLNLELRSCSNKFISIIRLYVNEIENREVLLNKIDKLNGKEVNELYSILYGLDSHIYDRCIYAIGRYFDRFNPNDLINNTENYEDLMKRYNQLVLKLNIK